MKICTVYLYLLSYLSYNCRSINKNSSNPWVWKSIRQSLLYGFESCFERLPYDFESLPYGFESWCSLKFSPNNPSFWLLLSYFALFLFWSSPALFYPNHMKSLPHEWQLLHQIIVLQHAVSWKQRVDFMNQGNQGKSYTLREKIFVGRKFREFRKIWPNSRK